jgi:hypothetical protein
MASPLQTPVRLTTHQTRYNFNRPTAHDPDTPLNQHYSHTFPPTSLVDAFPSLPGMTEPKKVDRLRAPAGQRLEDRVYGAPLMLPLPFAASVGTGWRLVVDLGLELNGEVREAGSAAEERVTRRGVTGCDIARASAVVGVGAVAVGTLVRRDQEWRAVVGVFGNFWAGRCGTGGQWAVVDRPFLDRLHFAVTEMGPNLEQPPPWSMGEAQE